MRDRLHKLLCRVSEGSLDVEKALRELCFLPFEDLGDVRFDHHRSLRTRIPEVVFCQGKEPRVLLELARRFADSGHDFIATRVPEEFAPELLALLPGAVHHERARMITLIGSPPAPSGLVGVLAAGSSDIPIAEEAKVTAETLGSKVEAVYDVGVAGLHRLMAARQILETARVLVVTAGMDGALPGVVAGLVGGPIVAVPTSVGYGASFGGISALLTMLNSCAPGVTVVNIDNGFGAGVAAHLINRAGER
jgi:NCAIR mutase (PurE)-related protein